MVTPIAIFAPVERPLDPDLAAAEEAVGLFVGELAVLRVFVDFGDEVVVLVAAAKAAKSVLCHQIGIPSPHTK